MKCDDLDHEGQPVNSTSSGWAHCGQTLQNGPRQAFVQQCMNVAAPLCMGTCTSEAALQLQLQYDEVAASVNPEMHGVCLCSGLWRCWSGCRAALLARRCPVLASPASTLPLCSASGASCASPRSTRACASPLRTFPPRSASLRCARFGATLSTMHRTLEKKSHCHHNWQYVPVSGLMQHTCLHSPSSRFSSQSFLYFCARCCLCAGYMLLLLNHVMKGSSSPAARPPWVSFRCAARPADSASVRRTFTLQGQRVSWSWKRSCTGPSSTSTARQR